MATRTGYIKTTGASQLDATNLTRITGIELSTNEPTGTQAKYLFKPEGGKWLHYDTSKATWEAVTTQDVTATSGLSEGNTKAELAAITDSEKLAVFAGKKIDAFVAVSVDSAASEMPTFDGIAINGTTGASTCKMTAASEAIALTKLHKPVDILDIKVTQGQTGEGKATVKASIKNAQGEWSEWQDYKNYVTSPATKALAIKFQADLAVVNIGKDEATVGSVTIKHRIEDAAVLTEGTGICITKTYNFTNPMTAAHLMVKHPIVDDTNIKAYIALRGRPLEVKNEALGVGNGASQTVTLKHKEKLASHGFTLCFDGKPQTANSYSVSTADGQVTFNAAQGVIVTADYIANWEKEKFVPMQHDNTYPDTLHTDMVDDQFDYQAKDKNDPQGSVAAVRVDIEQLQGTATDEALGAGTGSIQAFKLKHRAKVETLVIKVNGTATTDYTYKEATQWLFLSAPQGQAVTASYAWAAGTNYLSSIACVFNQ